MQNNLLKRIIGKAKRIAGIRPNAGVVVRSSKWLKNQSRDFENVTKRKLHININSNIEESITFPNRSLAIEKAIDKIVETEDHQFKNILVIKNPYQYAPLCAIAIFKTKKPLSVKVTIKGKTKDCDISYKSSYTTSHKVPIMGLYQDYNNEIVLELFNNKNKCVKRKTFKLYVEKLKGKNATINVTKSVSEQDYLYNLTLVYGGDDGISPFAFDKNGDIRFCFAMSPKTYGFQPISKGKFLFLNKRVTRLTFTNPTSTQLLLVDQMGRIYKSINVEKGAHHDFVETKKGNYVMASSAIEGGTFEDSVIEVDKDTGEVLNEIKIKDYIDEKFVDSSDWAHLNSIDYNEDDKTVMVCLRNLHAVIKINYEKKELIWILGNPEFWKESSVSDKVLKPEGKEMKWFFQAHATYALNLYSDNNSDEVQIIMYDNHVIKRKPVSYFDYNKNSNIRFYSINEKNKTVSMIKSFECEKSNIRSNALFDQYTKRVFAMSGKVKKFTKTKRSSIIEFDYRTKKKLNQFDINYGFYKAYPFEFKGEDMSISRVKDNNYQCGKVYGLCETAEKIDVKHAKSVPDKKLEDEYKTEEERKNSLSKLIKENPDYYIEPSQDMARIEMKIQEDMLYITLLDHFLERVYLVGKNHTYYRDYTETKQERPEYFARGIHIDPISLNDLDTDYYQIYFKHQTGLYKSEKFIEVKVV